MFFVTLSFGVAFVICGVVGDSSVFRSTRVYGVLSVISRLNGGIQASGLSLSSL